MNRIVVKLLLCLWMLGNPLLFVLIVAPTQPNLRPWLPDWFLIMHDLVYPWFYRPSAY